MEKIPNGDERPESLVERKRQTAFTEVCDALDTHLDTDIGTTFEVSGREYDLTSAEDCMVAYAQQLHGQMKQFHEDVVSRDSYYEEKATAKLLELFKAHERLVALYAELRSYYPAAAERAAAYLPPLQECADHGEKLWEKVQANKTNG